MATPTVALPALPSSDAATARANAACGAAFVRALRRAGVAHVVVGAGSRHTPLLVAVAAAGSGLRVLPVLDERAAAFVALGLVRASGRPVVLLTTSGSAGGHALPAVMEAAACALPLVVVTADRPPELHDCGAPQTITQVGMFGPYVRSSVVLPVPEANGVVSSAAFEALFGRGLAAAVGGGVGETTGAGGPVHINVPLREPLWLSQVERAGEVGGQHDAATPVEVGGAGVRTGSGTGTGVSADADTQPLASVLADRCVKAKQGVVVCGPMLGPMSTAARQRWQAAATSLAQALGWPVIADPLSQLRGVVALESYRVSCGDALARELLPSVAKPDLVLRLGAMPTSKALCLWLGDLEQAHQVGIMPQGQWHDWVHSLTDALHGDVVAICEGLAAAVHQARATKVEATTLVHRRRDWLVAWQSAEAAACVSLSESAQSGWWEAPAVRLALASIATQEPWGVCVGSSMPVRDVDAFVPRLGGRAAADVTLLSNRGVNGIDGMLATAAGAALGWAGESRQTLVVCGDLTFAHDVGGWLAAAGLGVSLVVVVLNNGGGGIFDFLPIAGHSDRHLYESYYRTPQPLDLKALAAAAGAWYRRVHEDADGGGEAGLRDAMMAAVQQKHGLRLVEVMVDSAANVSRFKKAMSRAGAAAAKAWERCCEGGTGGVGRAGDRPASGGEAAA